MAAEFFIPKLGQTVEEVTIVKWLVKDGQKIGIGDAIMEVETDKAVFPVESTDKGYIHIGPYKDGEVVPVLTVVAIIGKEGDQFEAKGTVATVEELETTASEASKPEAAIQEKPAPGEDQGNVFASPRARKLANEKSVNLVQVTPTGGGGVRVAERDVLSYLSAAPKATPVAQRVATAEGVDLSGVTGTGPGGRIVKEDVVQRVIKPAPITPPLPETEVINRVHLKGVRGIIAERMGVSVHTTARVTFMMEMDATELVAMRNRLKDRVAETWGFAPGYNDLLAKIVAAALRKYPYMNARLTPDAIEHLSHINIGLAVDTERGLLVPVIRDTDRKSLHQFGGEFRELVERARLGRSLPEDLSGGTFTITNLGMHDIDGFTPVINLPEAAILGVGRITAKPVVRDGEIVVRQMWTLSLVFDHRLVDGAPAARFFQYIKQLVEEPYLLLAE
jgi:pyruvate dehydrogenase E2 component (dihydrolipoamide acetyltransferase)